jgi:hypothetical protein
MMLETTSKAGGPASRLQSLRFKPDKNSKYTVVYTLILEFTVLYTEDRTGHQVGDSSTTDRKIPSEGGVYPQNLKTSNQSTSRATTPEQIFIKNMP